jgi:hypothetical protein
MSTNGRTGYRSGNRQYKRILSNEEQVFLQQMAKPSVEGRSARSSESRTSDSRDGKVRQGSI